LDLRTATIAAEARRVAARLNADPLDAEAHEEAALVVGALALREAAGEFSDARPALNRMAAHLAIAQSLLGVETSPVRECGEVLLLTLARRSLEAVERIEVLRKAKGTPARAAWLDALALRNTGDWRQMADPGKRTLLERLEYFRAVSERLGFERAVRSLDVVGSPDLPDWGRILMCHRGILVSVGHAFVVPSVARELAEVMELGQADHAFPMALGFAELNAPDAPLVAEGTPPAIHVLSPTAWGRFYARHLANAVWKTQRFYDRTLALSDEARPPDRAGAWADVDLIRLARLDGKDKGDEAAGAKPPDCSHAIAFLGSSPQMATAAQWSRVEAVCSKREAEIPLDRAWFGLGPPPGSAYEAADRLSLPGVYHRKASGLIDVGAMRRIDPFATDLARSRQEWKVRADRSFASAEVEFGPLLSYDLGLVYSLAFTTGGEPMARRRLLERLCAEVPARCFDLGDDLVAAGAITEAVRAFERGVDETMDEVLVANRAGWLVDHYFETGDRGRALALAQRAADTYSGTGLLTMAKLQERMERLKDAEGFFKAAAERYPSCGDDTFTPIKADASTRWTWPTAAFFIFILLCLCSMSVWEYFSPGGSPRRGILSLDTTRGDRLFISLLGSAFIFLAWLGIMGTPLWGGLIISLIYAFAVFRWV
jgi:predicted small integral membrane protein